MLYDLLRLREEHHETIQQEGNCEISYLCCSFAQPDNSEHSVLFLGSSPALVRALAASLASLCLSESKCDIP